MSGAASYPDVSLISKKMGAHLVFPLPMVPRASGSCPVARPIAKNKCEVPEEEAVSGVSERVNRKTVYLSLLRLALQREVLVYKGQGSRSVQFAIREKSS